MGDGEPPAIGAVFAETYRIMRPLGHGAMGSVYVAEQLATGAPRALKLMNREFARDPMEAGALSAAPR